MFWNCRGLGQTSTVQALREFCNSHRHNILFMSKVKISNFDRIRNIASYLDFHEVFLVPSRGSSGGIALMWKDCLDIQIVSFAYNFHNTCSS